MTPAERTRYREYLSTLDPAGLKHELEQLEECMDDENQLIRALVGLAWKVEELRKILVTIDRGER